MRRFPFMFGRRALLQGALASGLLACARPAVRLEAAPSGPGPLPGAELEEVTVSALQKDLASGRWTAERLTALYAARIRAIDGQLRSVIELNPDALELARALDKERRAGKVRGLLHGIPILIKDNFATADRMQTTAGSLALVGARRGSDAFVVDRLRKAGAVLLGKTNLSEWANFRSTQSSSGWSARGGQCRNPYAMDRSPCGSSSGSGTAIAANLAAVGVGTETDGSIVCPAAMCGLVGFKPTLGEISRSGIIPIAHSQDTAGPMARTVTDAAILFSAMRGADKADPATYPLLDRAMLDFEAGLARALDREGLRGARIGIVREKLMGYSPEADAIAEQARRVMKDAGAVLVDPANIPHLGEWDEAELTVLLYEFKADLNTYLAELEPGAKVRTLEDLIRFNREHAAEELPYFGQELFEQAQEKGDLTSTEYLQARRRCVELAGRQGIDAVMRQHNLDALFAPTTFPAFPIDLLNGDHWLGSSSSPAAVAGYPHITVPAGHAHGLPVGVSFFAGAGMDAKVLKLGYAFEQATRVRVPPRLLPRWDEPRAA